MFLEVKGKMFVTSSDFRDRECRRIIPPFRSFSLLKIAVFSYLQDEWLDRPLYS